MKINEETKCETGTDSEKAKYESIQQKNDSKTLPDMTAGHPGCFHWKN